MCGLVGAIANRNIVPFLVDGLRSLEYRGYDSAGVAILNGGKTLTKERSVGKVEALANRLASTGMSGSIGIGHTRWATHGRPEENNAHPHVSNELVAVVHNGIIENYEALRSELQGLGYAFESQTDTEVIAHRIHYHLESLGELLPAVTRTLAELEGSFAIAAICHAEPNRIIAARKGSPLVVGLGAKENFIASDITALLSETRRCIYLEEGDVADITSEGVQVYDSAGRPVTRPEQTPNVEKQSVEKGDYPHFMLKEIYEQGRALQQTLAPALAGERLNENMLGEDARQILKTAENIHICACGTSYHAGMVGAHLIETLAGRSCKVEHASEFRYRSPVVPANTLFVTLSQSGETADTLAAMRYARDIGYTATLAICNVGSSSLVRESDLNFLTQAGPEIGVASTKAFTTQLSALYVLAMLLGRYNPLVSIDEVDILQSLKQAGRAFDTVLAMDDIIRDAAAELISSNHCLFLGRGMMFPIAQEGALKLKEISYIHAEAYPGGELKHGPLALIDETMPVVALVPNNPLMAKMKANLQEVEARGGKLLIFTEEGCEFSLGPNSKKIALPKVPPLLAPMVYTLPMQLLAYHAAVLLGTNVDQPRNLAKSVTVE